MFSLLIARQLTPKRCWLRRRSDMKINKLFTTKIVPEHKKQKKDQWWPLEDGRNLILRGVVSSARRRPSYQAARFDVVSFFFSHSAAAQELRLIVRVINFHETICPLVDKDGWWMCPSFLQVVLIEGRFSGVLPLCSRNEPVFLSWCTPIAMPETRECVVQGATNIFTSIHSMDFKITSIDSK